MAQNDLLKRYMDAGMAFTQMTQQRAEAIVNNLVKSGEVQREQAQAMASELVDRSRRNTEKLLDSVRQEMKSQVGSLGLATKADIKRLEQRIDKLSKSAKSAPAKKRASAKKKSAAKKKSS